MKVNNLYDLHKKRLAEISKDYKGLIVDFEMRHPVGLKDDKFENNFDSLLLGCHISLRYNKPRLIIDVEQKNSDLNKLYKIFICIAYLLGDEIALYYFYKNFPYYDIPHYFNFGNHNFCFINNKKLISDTQFIIERCYELLIDDKTNFSKIVPALLSINSMNYSDVRFFSEFSLLEFLAKNYKISGNIFNSKEDKKELKKFSAEILSHLNKANYNILGNELFKQKIKKILSPSKLNEKGVSKDKIVSYMESFNSRRIKEYIKFVNEWNKLRSKKGLAHGNIFSKKDTKEENYNRMLEHELHQCLSDIVFDELKGAKR